MRPYNVELFTTDFSLVGNTNINSISYKEDYISSDDNSVTVFPVAGIEKQNYIRICRGKEEYVGIVTEITYGTDQSKQLQVITFKPLMELLNTGFLFDVEKQGQGTLEQFIADAISGPIRERIDLHVTSEKLDIRELAGNAIGMNSKEMREKVMKARKMQNKRFKNDVISFNSQIDSRNIKQYCYLGNSEQKFIEHFFYSLDLSARTYHKVLKIARTIADLEEESEITVKHLSEAVCYRMNDKFEE